jgi:hypothetical protein
MPGSGETRPIPTLGGASAARRSTMACFPIDAGRRDFGCRRGQGACTTAPPTCATTPKIDGWQQETFSILDVNSRPESPQHTNRDRHTQRYRHRTLHQTAGCPDNGCTQPTPILVIAAQRWHDPIRPVSPPPERCLPGALPWARPGCRPSCGWVNSPSAFAPRSLRAECRAHSIVRG